MATDLPAPAPVFEHTHLLGSWYVLITNSGFWQHRTHPHVEYTPLEPERGSLRMLDSLRFRQVDMLGRIQRKLLVGVDMAEQPGLFTWRGQGIMRVVRQRWCVALSDANHRWMVVWFARSTVGSAPGLDIYTRDPSIPQPLLDEILGQIRTHPFLGQPERPGRLRRCDGLFATTQDWIPPSPYRLDAVQARA